MDKKKIVKKLCFGSSIGLITTSLIIIIPCLMILDFFGANITDNYVENNMEYASSYKSTLNKALKNGYGYIPLNRILYFYLEDDKVSFYDIYIDNIDEYTNHMKPISEVCLLSKYKVYDVCKNISIDQIDEEVNKPFISPIDISKMSITSFFMEERIVFENYDIHEAWDLASSNETEVRSVCDGKVIKYSFNEKENVTNKNAGAGNYITIKCDDEENAYEILYGHLYPDSARVKLNDKVSRGEVIAGVGTTGYSTGPHLHYEVKLNGVKVDGMSLIDFNETNKPYINNNFEFNYELKP